VSTQVGEKEQWLHFDRKSKIRKPHSLDICSSKESCCSLNWRKKTPLVSQTRSKIRKVIETPNLN